MLRLLNLKFLLLLLIASFGSVIFSGCASTDRMKRLSPWQKDISKTIESKDVNLWPAYYDDGNGKAILWPIVDIDSKGFGIRPFYNQDGNRYSILFPLSGWNTDAGDGWALNSYWGKNYGGMFPIAHFGDNLSYATVFYWNNNVKSYGLFPLTYVGKDWAYVANVYWGKDYFGMFPLTHYQKDDLSFVTLAYWNNKKDYYGFFPFVRMTKDYSYIFNTYWDKESLMIFPLAYHQKDGMSFAGPVYWDKDSCGIFPIMHSRKNDLSFAGPVYWNNNKNYYGLFPVARIGENFSYAGPVYWDKKNLGFFPLGYFSDEFSYSGNVYWGKNYFGIFPLSHYKKGEFSYGGNVYWGKDYFGMFPLFHKAKDWFFAGPYYSKTETKQHVYSIDGDCDNLVTEDYEIHKSGVLPLFFQQSSKLEESSTLLPFYHYWRDKITKEYFFCTLLGGSHSDKSSDTQFSWLHFYNKDVDEDNKETEKTIFTPIYGQQWIDRKTSMVSVFANAFVYEKSDINNSYSVFWPFVNYTDYHDNNKNDSFYAFPLASVNSSAPAFVNYGRKNNSFVAFPLISVNSGVPAVIVNNEDKFSFLDVFGYKYEKKENDGWQRNILLLSEFTQKNDYKEERDDNYSNAWFRHTSIGKKTYCTLDYEKYSWAIFPFSFGEKSKVLKLNDSGAIRSNTFDFPMGDNLYALFRLTQNFQYIFSEIENIKKRKISYNNVLERERINNKVATKKINSRGDSSKKRLKELDNDLREAKLKLTNQQKDFTKLAKKLKLNYQTPQSEKDIEVICRDIVEENSKLVDYYRYQSIIYNYEKLENDYTWSILFGLLSSGRQQDDIEQMDILEYFYRYERSGAKYKRTMFPGISYFKDEENKNRRFSFLWRVLNIETKDNKTSGHVLFIPFGNK